MLDPSLQSQRIPAARVPQGKRESLGRTGRIVGRLGLPRGGDRVEYGGSGIAGRAPRSSQPPGELVFRVEFLEQQCRLAMHLDATLRVDPAYNHFRDRSRIGRGAVAAYRGQAADPRLVGRLSGTTRIQLCEPGHEARRHVAPQNGQRFEPGRRVVGEQPQPCEDRTLQHARALSRLAFFPCALDQKGLGQEGIAFRGATEPAQARIGQLPAAERPHRQLADAVIVQGRDVEAVHARRHGGPLEQSAQSRTGHLAGT